MARWRPESDSQYHLPGSMPPRARSDDPGGARARTRQSCRARRRTPVAAPKLTPRLPAQRLRRPDVLLKRQRPRRPRDRGAAITKEGRNSTKGRRRDARERLLARARFVFRGEKRTGRGQGPRQGLCRRTTTTRVRRRRVYGGVGRLFKWCRRVPRATGRARPARNTSTKGRVDRRVLTHDARRTAGHELAHGF